MSCETYAQLYHLSRVAEAMQWGCFALAAVAAFYLSWRWWKGL